MTKVINRALARKIAEVSGSFKILLLTGPRQVGKTTLLQEADKNRSYVTLDDLTKRAAALNDPAGFVESLDLPVLIDEVQYAPQIFPYIKMAVDTARKPGLFWLTGSQQFEMMKNVTESLAGRVGILNLQGISLAEEQERPDSPPFLPEIALLKIRQKEALPLTSRQAYHKIWRGAYPDVVTQNGKNWERFYDSYVSTYIQRDVQDYLGIRNASVFLKFMQVTASRTGRMVKYSEIASSVGVSEVTVKSWIDALRASGIITLLQPFFRNHTSRLIKTPKLYFMDTGLCSFLTGWLTPEVLERGAMAGEMLETYVVSEIVKSYLNNGRNPRLYFYRDKEQNEIDLLFEENGTLYPLEIKKTASPRLADCKAFNHLSDLKTPIGHGGILCFVKSLSPLSRDVDAIPVGYI